MKLSSIPANILAACRERGHRDDAIERMSPRDLFSEACNYQGLTNYGPSLYRTVLELREKARAEKQNGDYLLPFGMHIQVHAKGQGSVVSGISQILMPEFEPNEESEAVGFINGVEGLLLAMACAGVDLNNPAIHDALEACVEKAEKEYMP